MRWSRSEKTDVGPVVAKSSLWLALTVALGGCQAETRPYPPDSERVLVVYNGESRYGRDIADYYAAKRRIPPPNVVTIHCPDREEVSSQIYRDQIEVPVREILHRHSHEIDFIVLTKGVPIRIAEGGVSVDSMLGAAALSGPAPMPNPYFQANEPFSSHKYGFYLVTRLDGYSLQDCQGLVDRSLAAKPWRGPFLFDKAANRESGGYETIQRGLDRAARDLAASGFDVILENTAAFVAPSSPLAGYTSWGSNDAAFDLATYRRLRFAPGALCETLVSTSGRTFEPTQGGQSLIADLIRQGVTGVKGYVSEPYAEALAKPDILFDRFTHGRNLAESFYAASGDLKWKGVIVGDPLCAPYRSVH